MNARTGLTLLFATIFCVLLAGTTWASLHQSMFEWGGLVRTPDRYWTIATLLDAYGGFLTFYAWVIYKEPRMVPRMVWFIAIMTLGNMAMSVYVLRELARLPASAGFDQLLSKRNA